MGYRKEWVKVKTNNIGKIRNKKLRTEELIIKNNE
jgi:hypothetical protein